MYDKDLIVYMKDCIINSSHTLCGRMLYLSEVNGGYRHKYYEKIKCNKCRQLYEWLKCNGISNYENFMSEHKAKYYTRYIEDFKVFNDFQNGLLRLDTGISSYSKPILDIIKNVFISLDDLEYLKNSKEVKSVEVTELNRYDIVKGFQIYLTLIHGDKFYFETR